MSAHSPLTRRAPSETCSRPKSQERKSFNSNFRSQSAFSYPHVATIEAGLDTRLPGTWTVDAEACRRRGVPGFTRGLMTTFASATRSFGLRHMRRPTSFSTPV